MKRFLTLLLAAAMVLSFAACGDNGMTIRNENEEDNVKKDPKGYVIGAIKKKLKEI